MNTASQRLRSCLVVVVVGLLLAGCKPKDNGTDTEQAQSARAPRDANSLSFTAKTGTVQGPTGWTPQAHARQAAGVLRTDGIDPVLDRITTALEVVGLPEAVVCRQENQRLLVAFKLKTDRVAREMLTKAVMILSTVSSFKGHGEVSVVGFKYTQPLLVVRGDLAKTVRANNGDLAWPDYLASLQVEAVDSWVRPN